MKQSDLQVAAAPERADATSAEGSAPVTVTTRANDAEPCGPDTGGGGRQDCDPGEDGRHAGLDGPSAPEPMEG